MGDYVWHGHHENVCPIEQLRGTIAERQREIRCNKPEHERAIRLKLLKPCSPEAVTLFQQYEAVKAQARQQYEAVRAQARQQYEAVEAPAWQQYAAVKAQALIPILALHATECGCTEWNGQEIVFVARATRVHD